MIIIKALKNLIRRVPGRIWFAVGGCLLAAFWMQQHDARIRRQAGLQQLRKATSAEVAALRRQAAENMEQANVKNAQAVAKLEQRRQQLDQQNRQLAAQLARLRTQAQIQAGEVATLPISEIVTRVAAQLGLGAEDVAGKEEADAKAERKLPITNYELQKAGAASMSGMRGKTPHPAAGASTLSPRRGRGQTVSATAEDCHPEEPSLRGATKDPGSSGVSPGTGTCKGKTTGILRGVYPEPLHSVQGRSQVEGERAQDDGAVVMPLTASGARKVAASLVALDACRAESDIQTQQIGTCQARAEADKAAIQRLNGSVASLDQALAAKDKILLQQQSEYKAELRAARGTFLGRLARVTEHVAIGVAVGVAIGVAVK